MDKNLAEWLQKQLKEVGFNIEICSTDSAWDDNKDEYDKAAVLLPVLSQYFCDCAQCLEMLKRAHERQDPAFAILPIKNFGTKEPETLPFMRSVFYRANRVPSNEQFSM